MLEYLFLLPGLIIGLTVHEAAHALSAYWLGDHVAKSQGRISLNPFRHLSLFGTLAIFILGFGWGKPVPVNLYNFKHPKRDYLLTSLAGPASNVIMSVLAYGLLHLPLHVTIQFVLISIGIINAILAVVNLVPIPPLDGSKIWPCIIPGMRPVLGEKMSRYTLIVLLVIFYTGGIGKIVRPTVTWLGERMYDVIDDTERYTERPVDFPEVLMTPNDANDTYYTLYTSDGSHSPSYMLEYKIQHPYPFDATRKDIIKHIESLGWKRTQYDLYDPNEPATDTWQKETEEGYSFYNWSGDWIDPNNRWLSLRISYMGEPNEPNNLTTAYVEMYLDGPGSMDEDEYHEYRLRHPEEFNFTTLFNETGQEGTNPGNISNEEHPDQLQPQDR